MIPVLKNIGERSTAKNYCPVFEKLVNNGFLIIQRNVASFLISSVVLCQVFGQIFQEFQLRCVGLFLLSSVMDGFRWFWMGSLHKNIKLMQSPSMIH